MRAPSRDAEQARLLDEVKGEYLASEEGVGTKGLKRGQFLAKNKRAIANEAERRLIEWKQQNQRPGRADPGIDIVAEMFGFENGAAVRKAIKEAGKLKDRIEQETDRRMLKRHGDLVDPVSIERAAEAAVHNETRARFIATGLKMLAKSPIPARQLAEAAREAAEAAVAAKRVRDLRPAQHAAAEARANKEAIELAAKDPAGAAQQQRAALLNNRLFKAATDAAGEVQKGVAYLGKFDKASVREKIALEYREQIDALLDRFDLRKSTTNTALDARQSLLTFLEQLSAQGLEPQAPEALLNVAQFAPSLVKLITGSDKAADVAGKVVDIAKTVTSADSGEAALAAIQADPNKVLEFRQAVGAQQVDLEKAYLADRVDARAYDTEVRKLNGGHNFRADAAVMAVVAGLIACLWVLVQFKGQMPGEAVGILSTIAGILGSCLKDYFAFEFGSSRSSREKDETISKLSGA